MSSNKKFSELSQKQQRRVVSRESSSSSSSSPTQFPYLSEEQQNELALVEINEDLELHEQSSPISQHSNDVIMHEQSPTSTYSNNDIQQDLLPTDILQSGNDYDNVEVQLSPSPHFDDEDEDENYLFSDDDFLSSSDEDESEGAVNQLRDFCMRHLKDDPTKQLLKILREGFHLENVPKNIDELYHTLNQSMPEPVDIEGGKYLHLGIRANLKFVELEHPNVTQLTLNFSWDGVRLFKSSNTNIWPIVMNIKELPNLDVMLIGIFIGNSKPKNPNEFFYCFNKELMEIADDRYEVEVGVSKKRCTIHNDYMTADTPAKTWALGM